MPACSIPPRDRLVAGPDRKPDRDHTGSWHAVFVTAAIMDVIAAVMAIVVLKPMLKAHIARVLIGRHGG